MSNLTNWLLESPPWVEYRTRLDLMDQPETDPLVCAARQAMLENPQIQGIVKELSDWPGSILSSHKSAGHPLHKLTFIADLGLKASDPGIPEIIERIIQHQAPTGPFQVLMNISPSYGGTGEDQWAWALCDAPLVLYALIRFGLQEDARVQAGVEHLVSLQRANGWPCAVSPELGKFRGPGRKDDPCPFANLAMLKVMSQIETWRDQPASRVGAETLLALWNERQDQHPYMFFMGTDFCKLKAPLVWYDILHVVEVLSAFSWLQGDTRLADMIRVIQLHADGEGRFTPQSIWTAWKGWDFAQKHEPSRWLTLLAHRVLKRARVFNPPLSG